VSNRQREVVQVNPVTSRMGRLRLELRERFGQHFDRRACARRAGIAERTWASYERGENMPPVDAAMAIANVLGVAVEQLRFRRVESRSERFLACVASGRDRGAVQGVAPTPGRCTFRG
jgi:transcriptional regulator with XRE-family HTH domain